MSRSWRIELADRVRHTISRRSHLICSNNDIGPIMMGFNGIDIITALLERRSSVFFSCCEDNTE
jgi:hypothetical protein